ncbi:MAG: alpha/beta hydrolase-fold protein [Cryomorphaceae bacterium]|nr:esterase family protein [Flavobacteriales bacterium]
MSNTKRFLCALVGLSTSLIAMGQQRDTLTFYSQAFEQERSIYITLPEFHRFSSGEVEFPVVYVLDAQHDWFAEPIYSDIRYLEYTHEIPQFIVVEIPLIDRVKECGIKDIDGAVMPLHTFLTEEVQDAIMEYSPGEFRLLIGHSFSASFALYSYLKAPEFYSAVFSHSPLDKLGALVSALENEPQAKPTELFISVGSSNRVKDHHHRSEFENVAKAHPEFFRQIHSYRAENATHNAVPIIATPHFFSSLFLPFSTRFMDIAQVDENYALVNTPSEVEVEMASIIAAAKLGGVEYPLEIAEINGMASRYANSGYDNHAKALYDYGVHFYPEFFGFHLSLCEYYMEEDPQRARQLLETGEKLVERDLSLPDRKELLMEISAFRKDLGWE